MLLATLLAAMGAAPGMVRAASMEIWPAERRANNTLFCYGNDWNSMLIAIYPEDYGKQRLELPAQFAEPTVLTVTLPAGVEFLGADLMHVPGVGRDFPVESITREGKAYRRIRMTLPAEGLTKRLLQGKYYYHVFVWFAAPEKLDDTVSYELLHGDRKLAAGGSRLVTAGVVADRRALPKRFGFYPYGIQTNIPHRDYDRRADFLRRFGISGIESHWPNGLPADEPTASHLTFAANRRHGVKNIANMTLFASKYGGAYGAVREAVMKRGGLVAAMDESCAGLESEAALADWRAAHRWFDMALFDWEPTGPHIWPGYDDPATLAAFAARQGLAEGLTAAQVQQEHGEGYARFRMEQIARPVHALRRTMDAVKPIPLRVEQGSGATAHVDYDVYGHDFPALSPMIYQPSPLGYARNLLEMLAHTPVPAAKFWPDLTIGWPNVPVHRQTPQEFLLDTMVTAAAGCGSMSHWPGIHYSDASWFGIHEGLLRLAPVEAIYLDGQRAGGITLAGMPYREETISLGHRTLVHSAPDWRATLITFAHEYQGEHLLTLLNYHQGEDCFVRVTAPALQGRFLVNAEAQAYQVLDGKGQALVRVGKETPALWLVTADKSRVARLRQIEAATVGKEFAAARQAFLAASSKSEVQLGTTGDLTIGYAMTRFGGEERVTLQVKTPTQTLAFGPSGGRVYDWAVKGMPPFVAGDNHGTDGFIMDMLWLPSSARWSGDEVEEMTLVGCTNDGREARVVYEGALRKGAPGIGLRKTYRVPAAGSSLGVEVTFHNERVDAAPAKLAYWSHNVLRVAAAHFIGRELFHETPKGATTVLTAEGLPLDLMPEVVMPQSIIGSTGPVYAEYFPQSQSGLIVRLPDNFMNVYRWSHYGKPMCGSEWMSRPLSLGAGASATLRFSLTAVPEATPEKLREALAAPAEEVADDGNLLPFGFTKLNDRGLPVGWTVTATGQGTTATAAPEDQGEMVVKLAMPEEGSVQLDLTQPTRLDPAGDYMLVVQMKVQDMHHTGHWYERPAGVRLYVYGTDNQHTWLAVHGEGSTQGWITAVLPFPSSAKVRPHFAHSRVLLRCYNMTGTVSFRNPMIVRRPAGMEIQRSFTLEDGSQVTSAALEVRK
jgi:hypothetical protein